MVLQSIIAVTSMRHGMHARTGAGAVLTTMCRFDDPQNFGQSLKNFREYLNSGLPQMFAIAKEELNLQEEDLAFGYFCFALKFIVNKRGNN